MGQLRCNSTYYNNNCFEFRDGCVIVSPWRSLFQKAQNKQMEEGRLVMKLDDLFTMLIYSLLAIFGAMARQLRIKEKVPVKILAFLSGGFIASFMGIVIYFITKAFNIDPNLAYALSGLGGWVGPQLLDILADMLMKKGGLK